MAKVNINEVLLEDISSVGCDVNYYDATVYPALTSFMEKILDYEYLLDEPISKSEKLKTIKKYLKEVHHFKRKLIKKIDTLKNIRDEMKENINI